jgi:hypothetical protein
MTRDIEANAIERRFQLHSSLQTAHLLRRSGGNEVLPQPPGTAAPPLIVCGLGHVDHRLFAGVGWRGMSFFFDEQVDCPACRS